MNTEQAHTNIINSKLLISILLTFIFLDITVFAQEFTPTYIIDDHHSISRQFYSSDGEIFTIHFGKPFSTQTFYGKTIYRYSMSYSSENGRIEMVKIPSKIGRENAFFQQLIELNNKLYAVMESPKKIEDERKVLLWLIEFDKARKVFLEPIQLGIRSGRTMWERQAGRFEINFWGDDHKTTVYTYDWRGVRFKEPNLHLIQTFDSNLKLISKNHFKISDRLKTLSIDHLITENAAYFLIAEKPESEPDIEVTTIISSKTIKHIDDYWLFKVTHNDIQKIKLNTGNYELTNTHMLANGDTVSIISTLLPTVITKSETDEENSDYGLYFTQCINMGSQTNYFMNYDKLTHELLKTHNFPLESTIQLYNPIFGVQKNGNIYAGFQLDITIPKDTSEASNLDLISFDINIQNKKCKTHFNQKIRSFDYHLKSIYENIYRHLRKDTVHLFFIEALDLETKNPTFNFVYAQKLMNGDIVNKKTLTTCHSDGCFLPIPYDYHRYDRDTTQIIFYSKFKWNKRKELKLHGKTNNNKIFRFYKVTY